MRLKYEKGAIKFESEKSEITTLDDIDRELFEQLNLQKVEYWDTISKYLDEHYRIVNKQAREVTSVRDTLKMFRLLKSWVEKGLLEKVGKPKKGSFYRKPGQKVPKSLFSEGGG